MPNPSDFGSKDDFVSACISQRQDEHPDEDQDQSIAVCISMWSDKAMKQYIEPEDGESEDDFMYRCQTAGLDDDTCEGIWNGDIEPDDVYASAKRIIHKTHVTTDVQGMEFVLSDETIDRYGDVIAADGWDIADFRKNPIALFGHRSDFPIGTWENINVVGKELRGHLKMAPKGTSARIDEIRKLIDAGILKATSVGFAPVEAKPITKNSNPTGGMHYTKSSLLEVSVVAVPANPNALQVAKSLKISDATQKLVFAGTGARTQAAVTRRSATAGPPKRDSQPKGKTMITTPIAQRILDAEKNKVELRDKLNEHIKTVDDKAPTEEQQQLTDELTAAMETADRSLEQLKKVERHLAVSSTTPEREEPALEVSRARPFAVPARKINPVDYIFRALTVKVKHFSSRGELTLNDVLNKTYGERDEGTRVMLGAITKAGTLPATTTTSGWASDLVTVAIGDFFGLLQPLSVYARLSNLGGRFTFGTSGIVSLPTRSATPTIAGAFVAQGAPIPVKQGAFTAITFTPKKMGVISTMTREISEHSTPAIEQLIRDAILEDTANAIDAVLLDANPATAIRPAGLRNGLSTQSPDAGTDIVGVIKDLKNIMNQLFTGTNGNVRTPVWITTPAIANSIALSSVATGTVLPFREEVSRGTLMGYPLILSTNVTAGFLYLMDAADFVTATGDTPNFDVSDQATLHFEDTTPLDITTAAVATTVKNLWQTDSIGIRMRLDCNWGMRRANMVYFFSSLAWD